MLGKSLKLDQGPLVIEHQFSCVSGVLMPILCSHGVTEVSILGFLFYYLFGDMQFAYLLKYFIQG